MLFNNNHYYLIRKIFIFSFGALFLAIPKETLATAYYASSSGNNNNKGSLSSPFRTITYGIAKISGGDTLYVRDGIYVEQILIYQKSGTIYKPTVVMAFPGEKPIIDGEESLPSSSGDPMINIMSDYVVFDGFEVKNVDVSGNTKSSGIRLNGNCITVQNCTVHNVWGTGIALMHDKNIVQDCIVYNTSMNNSKNPGEQGNSAGISIRGYLKEERTADYNTIRRCVVHDIWGEAVSTVESTYSVIEDNIVYDGWEVCIYVNNSTHCLVQGNLVYQTKNMGGNQVGMGHWDENGSPLLNKNNKFINNIVFSCRRNFYSTKMIGTLVSNNTFVNSTYFAGVQLPDNEYENAVFINNIIVQEGDLMPIYAFSNPEMQFSHNLWSKKPSESASGAGDTIGDPMFAKIGSAEDGKLEPKYFTLLENSPAINKGIKNGFVTDDIFHNIRDSLPDMGASEYCIIVKSITVSGNSQTITTYKGTLQLIANILPVNAKNQAISWSIIPGTGRALISPTGLVTAVSDGTVTAIATSKDGSGVSGRLLITITGQKIWVTSINVTGNNGVKTIVENNGTLQLFANILPVNATNKSVSWSIEDGTGQAIISNTGVVTAVSDGIVTATASSSDGSGVAGNLAITISGQIITVTSLVIRGADFLTEISIPGGLLQLFADVFPADASNKSVVWSVRNGTGQASISSGGLLTAIADGTVIAKATANDGSAVKDSMSITIKNQIKLSITVNNTELRIGTKPESFFQYFTLYDILGKIVMDGNLDKSDNVFNVSRLLPGVYLVLLKDNVGNNKAVKVYKP